MTTINPKDLIGVTKRPTSTVSQLVLAEVGVGMLEGGLKYGRHNYRKAHVKASVYLDATMRHLQDWYEGQDIDPDSGLSHITKAICSLFVLRDAMLMDKWVDDRPPRLPELDDFIKDLNQKTKALLAKYPNPEAAYTEKPIE